MSGVYLASLDLGERAHQVQFLLRGLVAAAAVDRQHELSLAGERSSQCLAGFHDGASGLLGQTLQRLERGVQHLVPPGRVEADLIAVAGLVDVRRHDVDVVL
ncbi:hypothetical protein D3C81_1550610 [compost metagenome]